MLLSALQCLAQPHHEEWPSPRCHSAEAESPGGRRTNRGTVWKQKEMNWQDGAHRGKRTGRGRCTDVQLEHMAAQKAQDEEEQAWEKIKLGLGQGKRRVPKSGDVRRAKNT